MHLPDKRYCTLEFLKQLLSGAKRYFKNSEVRPVNVPRYKTLSLKHVLEFAIRHQTIATYLPDQLDKPEPQVDREFVFTIVNTCDPSFFPNQLARVE